MTTISNPLPPFPSTKGPALLHAPQQTSVSPLAVLVYLKYNVLCASMLWCALGAGGLEALLKVLLHPCAESLACSQASIVLNSQDCFSTPWVNEVDAAMQATGWLLQSQQLRNPAGL